MFEHRLEVVDLDVPFTAKPVASWMARLLSGWSEIDELDSLTVPCSEVLSVEVKVNYM